MQHHRVRLWAVSRAEVRLLPLLEKRRTEPEVCCHNVATVLYVVVYLKNYAKYLMCSRLED